MKPRPHSWFVLAVSGLIGFRLGWVAFPAWQVAVETAQVLAGVVRYPISTPFLIYHLKLWTILHQLLALGFRIGLTEIRLSLIVSGLAGLLSLQALAMIVYALSGDAFLAIGSALLIYFSGATEFGVTYPIFLMGSTDTYGMVGLSWMVLTAGLLGSGCYRTGLFIAGLAPAVHPSLGIWLLVILGISSIVDRERFKSDFLAHWIYFAAGCAVTAASASFQLSAMRGLPSVDRDVSESYLKAFVDLWDVHRTPVQLMSGGIAINAGTLGLAVLWLTTFRSDLTRSARFLLRFMIISAGLGLVFALFTWIPPERLPQTFVILMPSRLLNLDTMMAPALLFGLIGIYRRSAWSAAALLGISAALLLGQKSMMWTWLEPHRDAVTIGPTNTLAVLGLFGIVAIALASTKSLRPALPRRPSMIATAARVACFTIFSLLLVAGWRITRPPTEVFIDRTADPLFRVAAERQGILATAANLHLIQLRTRRPVLVDGGGLDGLPYALESATQLDDVLRHVYGIDFFHPPAEAGRGGRLPRGAIQTTWEHFSMDDWRRIGRQYGVTDVVTWADWTLHLPVAAQDRELRLYSIPD